MVDKLTRLDAAKFSIMIDSCVSGCSMSAANPQAATEIPPTTRTITLAAGAYQPVTLTAPVDCHVPRVIERAGIGAHEPHAIAACLAAMQTSTGPFYDVGANVGVFSLLVSSTLRRHSVSFEPTPALAQSLEDAAMRHYLPIEVKRVALGAKRGKERFYLSARSDASNSLNPEFRAHAGEIEVECDTLDNLAPAEIGVLKIDTETTEPDVIRGAAKTIARMRPTIVIEVLPSGETAEFMNAFLRDSGYIAYHVTSKAKWKLRRSVDVAEAGEDRNWLFSPQAVPDGFWTHLDAWRWRLLGK